MQLGAGYVVPELNVAPGEGTEESKEKMVSECRNIAISGLERAVSIGLPAVILEQEHIFQQTNNPDWTAEYTQAQAEVLEKV